MIADGKGSSNPLKAQADQTLPRSVRRTSRREMRQCSLCSLVKPLRDAECSNITLWDTSFPPQLKAVIEPNFAALFSSGRCHARCLTGAGAAGVCSSLPGDTARAS